MKRTKRRFNRSRVSVAGLTFASLCFVFSPSQARACQANVSAFESTGEVRMLEIGDSRLPRYVASRGAVLKDFPVKSPELVYGQANWITEAPVDRVELVRASAWRNDFSLTLASKADSLDLLHGRFSPEQWATNVVRYEFQVVRTLVGAQRRRFRLDRIRLPSIGGDRAPYSYWFLAPPSVTEDRHRMTESLRACESAAAAAKSTCDVDRVRKSFEHATIYRPRHDCAVSYAFRIGRPAVFYWRGNILAAVTEITPEAFSAMVAE